MFEQNMPPRLREGIDAAKRGDKTTARRLLQQVLSTDGDNELALMWMASVVDPLDERRFFLQRALQVNPDNTRAREALRRLGGPEPVAATTPRLRTNATNRAAAAARPPASAAPNTNLYLIAAAVVAFVVIAVIVASGVSSLQPTPTSTPTPVGIEVLQETRVALIAGSQTPTVVQPTATVLPGVVVTLDTSLLTPLPPTFTPTHTPEPSATPRPTATPFPLDSFTIIYSDLEPEVAEPSLYESNGDGTGETQLASGSEGGFTDIAYHAETQRIAFIRGVRNGDGDTLPQIFVAPLDDLESAEKITDMTGTAASHLSWSPDGEKIVFSANFDGDDEIWTVSVSSTSLEQITDNNNARDLEPSYSPDGEQIVFTSDDGSPGFSAIYVMDADGNNVTRLTDVPISKSPAWSPDGTRIAYINNSQGDDDVYVMDADGQRPFLVTVDDGNAVDSSPVWSPDGEWIFFASNREDAEETRWYAIDLQGNWERITVPGRTPQSLSFVTD